MKLRRLTEHRSTRTTRKLKHQHAIRSFRSRVKHISCKAQTAKQQQTKQSTTRKLQHQQANRSFRSRVKQNNCKAQFAVHKQTKRRTTRKLKHEEANRSFRSRVKHKLAKHSSRSDAKPNSRSPTRQAQLAKANSRSPTRKAQLAKPNLTPEPQHDSPNSKAGGCGESPKGKSIRPPQRCRV